MAIHAVVDDRNLVRLNGAKPHRLAMFSWALGFSLAAVSGVLVAPERGLNQVQLTLLVVNAYAAAVVGRLRSLPMTFVGALVLGIGQSLAATKLIGVNIGWFSLADLQYAVSPVLLFFAMLFLPSERLAPGRRNGYVSPGGFRRCAPRRGVRSGSWWPWSRRPT